MQQYRARVKSITEIGQYPGADTHEMLIQFGTPFHHNLNMDEIIFFQQQGTDVGLYLSTKDIISQELYSLRKDELKDIKIILNRLLRGLQ